MFHWNKKNAEVRQKIKQAIAAIEEEEKQKQTLVSQKLDYGYLQKLLDKVDENPALTITVILKSGDRIVLQQKQDVTNPWNNFDGVPSPEELEIK